MFFISEYMSLPGVAYANKSSPWKYLYMELLILIFLTRSLLTFLSLSLQGGFSCKVDPNKKKMVSFSQLYSSITMFLRTSWAIKRMVEVMKLGLDIGMMYFGMHYKKKLTP